MLQYLLKKLLIKQMEIVYNIIPIVLSKENLIARKIFKFNFFKMKLNSLNNN